MSEILVGPVQGGPCDGAKSIIASEHWDGQVRDLPGRYQWNDYRQMWVWKLPKETKIPKQFVHVKVSEAEFQRNAPNQLRRGKQPVSARDWDLR